MHQVVISGLDCMTAKLQRGSVPAEISLPEFGDDTAAGFHFRQDDQYLAAGSWFSTWSASHCLSQQNWLDRRLRHWPKKEEETMRCALAESERTQGNSSASKSKSRNTRRHVRQLRERERQDRVERPDTYPTLAVEGLSCLGNFGEDAL